MIGMLLSLGITALVSLFPVSAASQVRFEQRLDEKIPANAQFIDEYGVKRPLLDFLRGGPLILVFAYYRCPNLCTLVLNGLVQAVEKTDRVLVISIDPSEKSSLALAKKRSYLARLGVAEDPSRSDPLQSWHFLTGSEEQIASVARVAGFQYERDSQSQEYAHPSGIVVLSAEGRISQYFFGIQFDRARLHAALRDASHGKSGKLLEEILLYCFHYDPKLTPNGPLILKAIRISAILGALALIALLIWLSSPRKSEGTT